MWALSDFGFRVVISSRFADIFAATPARRVWLPHRSNSPTSNCCGSGWSKEPGLELTVSLEDRTVTAGDLVVPLTIDDYTRWRLMEGLDDIGLTLRQVEAISAYEKSRPSWKPTTLRQ